MMKNIFRLTCIALGLSLPLSACHQETGFVKVKNDRFEIDGKPYYYIGTNFWYGGMLGSTGQGGDRQRLARELDVMQKAGINNLRVLVGADGPDGAPAKVRPALQTAPGVYNDTIFDGLDYFLAELGKRKMHAVLFINNSWDWSGGYSQYLEWANVPVDTTVTGNEWQKLSHRLAQYAGCEDCKKMFFDHVRHVIGRTNRYTGLKYTDDPAIMSWQVGNEPRAFSQAAKPAFRQWLKEATALIRSLDPNHLISIGSEGLMGCEVDMQLFEDIHADPNVDYTTIHIWPKNWSWIRGVNPEVAKNILKAEPQERTMYGRVPGQEEKVAATPDQIEKMSNVAVQVDKAIAHTKDYIDQHIPVVERLKKPLVIEEFGYPRDHHEYVLTDPVTGRDQYYRYIFTRINESWQSKGILQGCNFWAWGGTGRATHEFWQPWDNYLGDPSQEEQGLNAVFDTDTTIELIKEFTVLWK